MMRQANNVARFALTLWAGAYLIEFARTRAQPWQVIEFCGARKPRLGPWFSGLFLGRSKPHLHQLYCNPEGPPVIRNRTPGLYTVQHRQFCCCLQAKAASNGAHQTDLDRPTPTPIDSDRARSAWIDPDRHVYLRMHLSMYRCCVYGQLSSIVLHTHAFIHVSLLRLWPLLLAESQLQGIFDDVLSVSLY